MSQFCLVSKSNNILAFFCVSDFFMCIVIINLELGIDSFLFMHKFWFRLKLGDYMIIIDFSVRVLKSLTKLRVGIAVKSIVFGLFFPGADSLKAFFDGGNSTQPIPLDKNLEKPLAMAQKYSRERKLVGAEIERSESIYGGISFSKLTQLIDEIPGKKSEFLARQKNANTRTKRSQSFNCDSLSCYDKAIRFQCSILKMLGKKSENGLEMKEQEEVYAVVKHYDRLKRCLKVGNLYGADDDHAEAVVVSINPSYSCISLRFGLLASVNNLVKHVLLSTESSCAAAKSAASEAVLFLYHKINKCDNIVMPPTVLKDAVAEIMDDGTVIYL